MHSWTLGQLPADLHPHLPDDHRPDGRDGGARHGHRCRRSRFPFAYYMARVASRRADARRCSSPCCCRCGRATWPGSTPGSSSSQKGGTLSWTLTKLGPRERSTSATRNTAMWIVFSYIWLPFMIVPVYGALERIPDSLLEASGDLGARNWRTLRSVVLPLALPGRGGRLDLHLLAHARRLHHADPGRRGELELHRQRHLLQHRHGGQPAVRGGAGHGADRDHDRLPARGAGRSARSRPM